LWSARRDEERQGVKSLPVPDADQKLVGILSMLDILKAVYPAYMPMMNLGDFTRGHAAHDRVGDHLHHLRVVQILRSQHLRVDQKIMLIQGSERSSP
jgi:hypothetical protein